MQAKKGRSRFVTVFKNAEATRRRLVDLERSTRYDFPCAARLIDPTALGALVGAKTTRVEKLSLWIALIEEGYILALIKAAVAERGQADPACDNLPTLDAYLRAHDEDDGHLLDFAGRLLALSDDDRCACTVGIYGAPDDSEMGQFAPLRRGLLHGVGGPTPDIGDCDSQTHASVIRLALQALGPTAAVKSRLRVDSSAPEFHACWSLATETWIPWLWMGTGDPQAALVVLYVNACTHVMRTEYDWWVSKAPTLLAEDNPVLCWLVTPNEPNRLAALNFALRHTVKKSDAGIPGEAAKNSEGARPQKSTAGERVGGSAADSEPTDRPKLSPSRVKAAAVYEWAIEAIPGADKMPIRDLFPAILEKLVAVISAAPPGAGEVERLQELRDSLPNNAETFGKYLRDAGIKRYNAAGERVRRTSHFKHRDQL